MAAPRFTEFPAEKFNADNSSHLEFVRHEINYFKKLLEMLQDFDKKFLIPPGVSAGTILLGSTTLFGVICVSLASLYCHYSLRPPYYNPYHLQLSKLVEIYHWGLTGEKNHEIFAELKQLLTPFTSPSDLHPSEKKPESSSWLQSTGNMIWSAGASVSGFFSSEPKKSERKTPTSENTVEKKTEPFDWKKTNYEQAKSIIKFHLYGYNPPKVKEMVKTALLSKKLV